MLRKQKPLMKFSTDFEGKIISEGEGFYAIVTTGEVECFMPHLRK